MNTDILSTRFQATTETYTMSTGPTKNTFQVIDYVVFGIMLVVSALIGIFFAVRNRRKAVLTTDAYLMASRKMSYGPVSMSLIATVMSSVTILGVPAEYYIYGSMFTWFALPYAILPLVIGFIYMPVFYDLGISSTYQYLEMRFNRTTKLVTTFMYIVLSTLYGGVVVYGPSLALSEVTGFDMWVAILSTGLVCIFYTSLGGLKAVIWTDVFQAVIMIVGFVAVIIQGSINFGGFGNIWNAAAEGGRIDFIHFELDPRIRHTFWSITFGGGVFWLGVNGFNQTQVQRYVCCKSKREAQIAIMWNGVGMIVILVLAGMTGLTIYATYRQCDPLNSGKVSKADQLFPFIVMEMFGHIPGITGLFVAGVYSSSISTISSGMNAMACVTIEDFVKPFTQWRQSSYTILSRFLVIFYGISFIIFAYLASVLGGLMRMSYSIHGIISGPIVGLFSLGILLPFVNAWGALIGVILGWASTIWLFIGSVLYPIPAEFLRKMPRSTEECLVATTQMEENFSNLSTKGFYIPESSTPIISFANTTTQFIANTTVLDASVNGRPPTADFYAISYLYIAGLGCLVTLVFGILISLITGMTKSSPPSNDLLCPLFYHRRDDGKPTLERSSSWFSPTDLAKAQAIRRVSDISLEKLSDEFEPFNKRRLNVENSFHGKNFCEGPELS